MLLYLWIKSKSIITAASHQPLVIALELVIQPGRHHQQQWYGCVMQEAEEICIASRLCPGTHQPACKSIFSDNHPTLPLQLQNWTNEQFELTILCTFLFSICSKDDMTTDKWVYKVTRLQAPNWRWDHCVRASQTQRKSWIFAWSKYKSHCSTCSTSCRSKVNSKQFFDEHGRIVT